MKQREHLCYPVLTVTQFQSLSVRYTEYINAAIKYMCIDIPQLPSNLMLTPGFTSIMISWMQPRYSPSNYIVSYSCQLLCDTTSIMTNGSVTVESTLTNIFSSLAPGSCCTISVVAVYDGIGMSNTVSSFTSTLSLGINDNYELISTSFQLLIVLLKD